MTGPQSPARIRRRSRLKATDEIIETLRSQIVTGRLAQGSKMPSERQLADEYGVSQPTVREALTALEILGLVEARQGSGTFVTGHGESALSSALLTLIQLQDVGVLQVQAVRRVLGLESASLAAVSATGAQVDAIYAAVAKIDEISKISNLNEILAVLLHHQRVMAAAANNPLLCALENFLATLMVELQSGIFRSRSLSFWRDRIWQLQPDRRALAEAIHGRDPVRARDAAVAYYARVGDIFSRDGGLHTVRLSDPLVSDLANAFARQLRSDRR